jgi:twinkle protein
VSSITEKLENAGINVSKIRGGKTICPKCSHTRKNKNDPCLSVDLAEGVYNCHNCGWCGGVKEKRMIEEKTYFKPVYSNRTDLPKNVVDYFFTRGIGQETLLKSKITSGTEWMPQIGKETNAIQFNYFRNGELINVKYRDARKNFKMVKDAELIFYNLDAIKESDWCVITEGEMDALTFIECGIDQVVSVPNGASKGNQKMDYLDSCYSYFENKKKVVIATDNDEAGRALREELGRRIGFEVCVWIDFGEYKDANDLLKATRSKEAVKKCLEKTHDFKIDGIFTIDDVWDEVSDIYSNGLPTGSKTGDDEFDAHLGIMPGELTMVTGIPGHGKSIFLDQISLKLCLNSGWKFGICSPESHPVAFYYTRLIKRLLGKKFSSRNVSTFELEQSRDWIKDRYNLIAPPSGYNLDEILAKARHLVLKKGIKGLIIDPWNRIEMNAPAGGERRWINEQLDKLIRFAQKNGVHIFLVAHPTKMQKDKDGINFLGA